MKDLLSTTSVPATVESWRQQVAKKIQPETRQSKVQARLLTYSEKKFWQSKFEGDIKLPWYAALFEDEVLLIAAGLPALICELRNAGYQVYDVSQLA